MTREQAKDILKNAAWLGTDKDREQTEKAVEMAISALEQEPCETSTDEPMTMVYPTIFCEDAISRRKAISVISACDGKSAQIEALEQLPSVQPSRKGHWITTDYIVYKCSECEVEIKDMPKCMCEVLYNYCPYCGVDMRGAE